tara:strand:+ start:833 stop:1084 length:252 start_codon:yes stop_codon:yes gene_type:complete
LVRAFAGSESSGLKSAADDVFDVFRKGADAATQGGRKVAQVVKGAPPTTLISSNAKDDAAKESAVRTTPHRRQNWIKPRSHAQ